MRIHSDQQGKTLPDITYLTKQKQQESMIRKEDRLPTLAAAIFMGFLFIALNMNEVLNEINSLN